MPTTTSSSTAAADAVPPPPAVPFPPTLNNASTSTVRRNLFHAHLSRRPASSASTSSTATTMTNTTGSRPTSSRTTTAGSSRPTSSRSFRNPTKPAPAPHKTSSTTTSTRPPAGTTTTATTAASKTHSSSANDPFSSLIETPTTDEIVPRDAQSGAYLGLSTLPTLKSSYHHQHSNASSSAAAAAAFYTTTSSTSPFTARHRAASPDSETMQIEKTLLSMTYRSRTAMRGYRTQGGQVVAREKPSPSAAGRKRDAHATTNQDLIELYGVVRESLRRKIAWVDDSAWMFGGGAGAGGPDDDGASGTGAGGSGGAGGAGGGHVDGGGEGRG